MQNLIKCLTAQKSGLLFFGCALNTEGRTLTQNLRGEEILGNVFQ